MYGQHSSTTHTNFASADLQIASPREIFRVASTMSRSNMTARGDSVQREQKEGSVPTSNPSTYVQTAVHLANFVEKAVGTSFEAAVTGSDSCPTETFCSQMSVERKTVALATISISSSKSNDDCSSFEFHRRCQCLIHQRRGRRK